MFDHIIVPLDLSPVAEQSLRWARVLAARMGGRLTLLHALETAQPVVGPTTVGEMELHARDDLERVATSLRQDGLAVDCVVAAGPAAQAILGHAARSNADLIAMSTHGRGGVQRWVYGSIADKLLHASPVPVLLVRAQLSPDAGPPALHRLLVPLDRSPLAERALPPATALALAFDAELLLYHVWDTSGYTFDASNDPAVERVMRDTYAYSKQYMVDVTQRLAANGVHAHWQAESGDIAEHILNAADSQHADLIVMSTHGLSGVTRWMLGSIADRVLRHATKPLLLVRATG
ncbi:MAG: universal stress protein [Chloroflexi bacterium]|nr:universal stress protein [Chloroflexota bacterium]